MTPEEAAYRLKLIREHPADRIIVPQGQTKQEARKVERNNARYESWLERVARGEEPSGQRRSKR